MNPVGQWYVLHIPFCSQQSAWSASLQYQLSHKSCAASMTKEDPLGQPSSRQVARLMQHASRSSSNVHENSLQGNCDAFGLFTMSSGHFSESHIPSFTQHSS